MIIDFLLSSRPGIDRSNMHRSGTGIWVGWRLLPIFFFFFLKKKNKNRLENFGEMPAAIGITYGSLTSHGCVCWALFLYLSDVAEKSDNFPFKVANACIAKPAATAPAGKSAFANFGGVMAVHSRVYGIL